MKNTKIIFPDDVPIPQDEDGKIYAPAILGPNTDCIEDILKAVDSELTRYGLELFNGDAGSSDYFFHVAMVNGTPVSELEKFSNEELQKELDDRNAPPEQLPEIDFESLKVKLNCVLIIFIQLGNTQKMQSNICLKMLCKLCMVQIYLTGLTNGHKG